MFLTRQPVPSQAFESLFAFKQLTSCLLLALGHRYIAERQLAAGMLEAEPRAWCCRNLNYWDSVSTLAGEVSQPRKTFPRALFIGVGLVVFMYLGPLLVGLGVTTDADNWELGYFTEVAKLVRVQSHR